MLQSKDVETQSSAMNQIDNLEHISPDFIPGLIAIITAIDNSDDKRVNSGYLAGMLMRANSVLCRIGSPALPAVKKLMHNDNTRLTAVGILLRIGTPALDALPELISALHDKNGMVRLTAAEVIMQLGPKAKAAVPGLISLVDDKIGLVREVAINALGKMGEYGEPALPALHKAEKNGDSRVRFDAGNAIKEIEADRLAK